MDRARGGAAGGLILASFVFPLEFLAAAIAFLARDTVAAAALGVFSTSWLTVGLLLYTSPPGSSAAFGWYLVAFTAVVLALAVAASFGKPLIAVLLVLIYGGLALPSG